MFLRVIILLLLLSITLEFYLSKHILRDKSRAIKTLYFTALGVCIIPYSVILILGQFVEHSSPTASLISSVALTLFLINFLWKTPLALALLLSSRGRHTWLRKAAFIFSIVATLVIFYGSLWERHQLRTTHLTLHYKGLPEGADGLRIVQISDLHIGYLKSHKRLLERTAQRVMSLQPDLVVDCGDMVNVKYTELDSATMATLSQISAPLGVYTVLGNHDRGDYITDTVSLPRAEHLAKLIESQRSMGWQNITDQTVTLPIGGDTLYLTAINYPASLHKGDHGAGESEDYTHHFAHLPEGAFNIILAHTPVMWGDITAATHAELTLSGHVHAMQLRLPIGPRGWSPAAFVYSHWSGLYEKEGQRLFVSDGIGGGVPFRVGAKPQIVVITLKKV